MARALGIFPHIEPDFLKAWLARPEVIARSSLLKSGERHDAERFNRHR